jgi:hypothetical protein
MLVAEALRAPLTVSVRRSQERGMRPLRYWNAELVRGDLGKAVQQLERESGKGLFTGGVKLPMAWF